MKYLKFMTSTCISAMLWYCLIEVPGVETQGLNDECPCWQKLAEEIRKQIKADTEDRASDALWMIKPLYNLLRYESAAAADDDTLSSEGQSELDLDLHRGGHSALRKLLLRRSTRSKPFRDGSTAYRHCNVCWTVLQELSNPALKSSKTPNFFDFNLNGISKKAMMNNGW